MQPPGGRRLLEARVRQLVEELPRGPDEERSTPKSLLAIHHFCLPDLSEVLKNILKDSEWLRIRNDLTDEPSKNLVA